MDHKIKVTVPSPFMSLLSAEEALFAMAFANGFGAIVGKMHEDMDISDRPIVTCAVGSIGGLGTALWAHIFREMMPEKFKVVPTIVLTCISGYNLYRIGRKFKRSRR